MPIDVPPSPPPAEVRPLRERCIAAAAQHYRAHPDLIRALIRTEGGATGMVRRNSNGSYDMGVMQINSIHLPELATYGIGARDLIWNECLNIFIGTWYLQSNILRRSNLWEGIGDYHSRTPSLNVRYQQRVYRALQALWTEKR